MPKVATPYHLSCYNSHLAVQQSVCIIVLALDFSKAFDTIRQATLLNKMAFLDIPDAVYSCSQVFAATVISIDYIVSNYRV